MIVEVDTSFRNDLHPPVRDWLSDHVDVLRDSQIMWYIQDVNKIHTDGNPYSWDQEHFNAWVAEYKKLVPADADEFVNEILREYGDTWVSYRVKYIFEGANRSLHQKEKMVICLPDADAVMLKLAFSDSPEFKFIVHPDTKEEYDN